MLKYFRLNATRSMKHFFSFFSAGFPSDTEEFYSLLKEFLGTTFGLPFSKYIELSENPIRIKVRRSSKRTTRKSLNYGMCITLPLYKSLIIVKRKRNIESLGIC